MNYLEFEKPLAEIEGKAEELRAMARQDVKDAVEAIGFVPLEWDHTKYEEIVGGVDAQLNSMGNALAWEEEELKKLQ